MKSVKLTNSFHKTSINIHRKSWMVPENQEATWWYIQFRASDSNDLHGDNNSAKALMRRIKKKLCGINDCTCGTVR